MLNSDTGTKQMGFGMAIGILLASFVVSTLLVPAVTTLAGDRAWWPSRAGDEPEPEAVAPRLEPEPVRMAVETSGD